jgi:hypothetical protein
MAMAYVYDLLPGLRFEIADARFVSLPAKYVQLPPPVGTVLYIRGKARHPYLDLDRELSFDVDLALRGLLCCSTCRERVVFAVPYDGLTINFPWVPAHGWIVCDPLYDSKQRPEVEQEVRCRVVCPRCADRLQRQIQQVFRDGGRT